MLPESFEKTDWIAGFLYDIAFAFALVMIAYFAVEIYGFFIWGAFLSDAQAITLISLFWFLQFQSFIAIKSPRHGWKSPRGLAGIASILMLFGVFSSVIPLSKLPISNPTVGPITFVAIIVVLSLPLIGIILSVVFMVPYLTSLWKGDKEMTEVLSSHSAVYRTLHRIRPSREPKTA